MDVYLASDFSAFRLFPPDERGLSEVIAELLRPAGKHGQGAHFLQSLLARLGQSREFDSGRVRVRCEEPVEGGPGFMDILVDLGDFGVGIENKPWAGEQENQLNRYWDYLDRKYKGQFCLVYLSGSGDPPTTLCDREARERQGQFCITRYAVELAKWLESCENLCKADKVRWFLRDFQAYVCALADR